MEYLDSKHPFFSATNITKILNTLQQRIRDDACEDVNVVADDKLINEMYNIASEYPQFLVTADINNGINYLNEFVVRKALKDILVDDTSAQYLPNNVLFANTRKAGRTDDNSVNQINTGNPILGSGIYKKRTQDVLADQKRIQQQYLNNPIQERFIPTQVRETPHAQFRHDFW